MRKFLRDLRAAAVKPTFFIGAVMAMLFLAAMPARAQAPLFNLTFDENGNATLQVGSNSPSSDPGYIDSNGFLAYNLPGAVSLGDVAIEDPGVACTSAATCSDGLRFLTLAPNDYAMEFMSTLGGGDKADTGFASNFNFSFVGATESADGSFTYIPSDTCTAENCYFGTSSPLSSVPAPASLALFGSGLLSFAFLRRRKRA